MATLFTEHEKRILTSLNSTLTVEKPWSGAKLYATACAWIPTGPPTALPENAMENAWATHSCDSGLCSRIQGPEATQHMSPN